MSYICLHGVKENVPRKELSLNWRVQDNYKVIYYGRNRQFASLENHNFVGEAKIYAFKFGLDYFCIGSLSIFQEYLSMISVSFESNKSPAAQRPDNESSSVYDESWWQYILALTKAIHLSWKFLWEIKHIISERTHSAIGKDLSGRCIYKEYCTER